MTVNVSREVTKPWATCNRRLYLAFRGVSSPHLTKWRPHLVWKIAIGGYVWLVELVMWPRLWSIEDWDVFKCTQSLLSSKANKAHSNPDHIWDAGWESKREPLSVGRGYGVCSLISQSLSHPRVMGICEHMLVKRVLQHPVRLQASWNKACASLCLLPVLVPRAGRSHVIRKTWLVGGNVLD